MLTTHRAATTVNIMMESLEMDPGNESFFGFGGWPVEAVVGVRGGSSVVGIMASLGTT
jgi:hypothetical protein